MIGKGFFNSLHADGKTKFNMDIGNLYKLKFAPKKEPDSPGSRRMKGQIFTALVLDFIKKEGETAVVLEWKDVPVGVVNVKDKKQTLPHPHFVADYQILKP